MTPNPTLTAALTRADNLLKMVEAREATIAHLRVQLADAAKRGYQAGFADGYTSGCVDAVQSMSPAHGKALSIGAGEGVAP